MPHKTNIEELKKSRAHMMEASGLPPLVQLKMWWMWCTISEEDQKEWEKLINRLARKYMKGSVSRKSGPTVWTQDKQIEFFCDYNWIKGKYPEKSDAEICGILRTIEPWKKRNLNLENTCNRLSLIRKFLRKENLLQAFTFHHKMK